MLLHALPKPFSAVPPRSLPTNQPFGKSKREEKLPPPAPLPSKPDRLLKVFKPGATVKLEPKADGQPGAQWGTDGEGAARPPRQSTARAKMTATAKPDLYGTMDICAKLYRAPPTNNWCQKLVQ